MSLAKTKTELETALAEKNFKVISLSGKWGTGKTFMWASIKSDPSKIDIKDAIEVSLFGLDNLAALKSKIFLEAIPLATTKKIAAGAGFLKGIINSFGFNLPSLADVAEVSLPHQCKGKLIVLDDCERAEEGLTVAQLFGFISEFIDKYNCRFLLLQNAEKLHDRKRWDELREKVIDRELILDSTPDEAYKIAVGSILPSYGTVLSEAVRICEITNIRVIKLIRRDIDYLLPAGRSLSFEVHKRVIPSIVLFAGVHYRAIENAPVRKCVDDWFPGAIEAVMSKIERAEADALEFAETTSHDPLLTKLGIIYFDEFEYACAQYYRTGSNDPDTIKKCVDLYESDARILAAEQASISLVQQLRFDWKLDSSEKVKLANSMTEQCQFLTGGAVSYLAEKLMEYPEFAQIGQSYVDTWIESAQAAGGGGYSLGKEIRFGASIHPKITEWYESVRNDLVGPSAVESLFNRIDTGDHASLEELNKLTIDDFKIAFETVDWKRAPVLFQVLFGVVSNSRSELPSANLFKPIADKIMGAIRQIQDDETGDLNELSKILVEYSGNQS
jgi:hypothetical protein